MQDPPLGGMKSGMTTNLAPHLEHHRDLILCSHEQRSECGEASKQCGASRYLLALYLTVDDCEPAQTINCTVDKRCFFKAHNQDVW